MPFPEGILLILYLHTRWWRCTRDMLKKKKKNSRVLWGSLVASARTLRHLTNWYHDPVGVIDVYLTAAHFDSQMGYTRGRGCADRALNAGYSSGCSNNNWQSFKQPESPASEQDNTNQMMAPWRRSCVFLDVYLLSIVSRARQLMEWEK